MTKTIKILDLFAGVGGLSLGFEMIKNKQGNPTFELHRAVEIDKYVTASKEVEYGLDSRKYRYTHVSRDNSTSRTHSRTCFGEYYGKKTVYA